MNCKKFLLLFFAAITFQSISAQCKVWTVYSYGDKNKCVLEISQNRIFSTYADGTRQFSRFFIDSTQIWATYPGGDNYKIKYHIKGNQIWDYKGCLYLIEGNKVFTTKIDGKKINQIFEFDGNMIWSTFTDGERKERRYYREDNCLNLQFVVIAIVNHLTIKNL